MATNTAVDVERSDPLIFAHRGSTILAPENTALAFDLALEYAADVLETDVRLSRDGVVFVTHDETLDRTTNGSGLVRDHLATDLAGLDAGYRFSDPDGVSARGAGARLMTLEELLAHYPTTPVNVDIKDNSLAAALAVATVIERAGASERVTVGSFHGGTLTHFREVLPGIATAATQSEVAHLYFRRLLPGINTTGPGSQLAYHWLQIPPRWRGIPLATRSFITTASSAGVRIAYWTINDATVMQKLVAGGAHAIVTDRPDIAHELYRTTR